MLLEILEQKCLNKKIYLETFGSVGCNFTIGVIRELIPESGNGVDLGITVDGENASVTVWYDDIEEISEVDDLRESGTSSILEIKFLFRLKMKDGQAVYFHKLTI